MQTIIRCTKEYPSSVMNEWSEREVKWKKKRSELRYLLILKLVRCCFFPSSGNSIWPTGESRERTFTLFRIRAIIDTRWILGLPKVHAGQEYDYVICGYIKLWKMLDYRYVYNYYETCIVYVSMKTCFLHLKKIIFLCTFHSLIDLGFIFDNILLSDILSG